MYDEATRQQDHYWASLTYAQEEGIRQGIEQGKAASILELLEETGKVSEQLRQKILDQHDSEILSKWLKLAAKAETIEEFERRIASDKV